MAEKHTRGPWAIRRNSTRGDGYVDIDSHKGAWGALATVVVEVDGKPSEVGEANASLIVAAPELLAAVRPSDGGTANFPDELDVVADIIDRYDQGSGLGRHLRERATLIRAAIAKATEPSHG